MTISLCAPQAERHFVKTPGDKISNHSDKKDQHFEWNDMMMTTTAAAAATTMAMSSRCRG